MQPGSGNFKYDYSSNDISNVGFNGLFFLPDSASTSAFNVIGSTGNDEIYGASAGDSLDGYHGNDVIFGLAGNDKLSGDKGDDTLDGGEGNDKIDGGKGTDTAVYHGNYADFVITESSHGHHHGHHWHHHHDDKITVAGATPAALAANGTDTLENVEFLKFDDATVNVESGDVWQYSVNATPDPAAQDPANPGDLFVGSGIPAEGFGLARNEDAGIELGLQVIYRQGPTVTTTDDYADGVLRFEVADGAQSTANGSSMNNANRAAWNFNYSIATGLNGETTDLDNFTFKLLIDTDPTAATSYVTMELEPELTPQAAGQSGFQWRDDVTSTVLIADDEGNANVTQNSQNYAFYSVPGYNIGTGFTGPAEFDIQLQAFDSSNNLIAQNHIALDIIV
jgi:hypothetical protein